MAFVFAAAGVAKALNPQAIGETMGVLFGGWSPPVWFVAALVLAEVVLAAWLVSCWRPRMALGTAIAALLGFSVALGALLIIKPSSPCGCGLPALSGNATVDNGLGIARNSVLIAIAALAWPSRHSLHTQTKEIQ